MKTKILLASVILGITAVGLGSGPLLADDGVEEQNQHPPSINPRLKAPFFPGFRGKPGNPFISFFIPKEGPHYPFEDELEKADDTRPRDAFDGLNSSHPPVGNIFRLDF
ncbi:MAG: hypothetical protein ACE5H7_15675 [Acidiferrobacterales bacterium]